MTPFSATCPMVTSDNVAALYCTKPLPVLSHTCMREKGAECGGAMSGQAPMCVRSCMLAGVRVLTLLAGGLSCGCCIEAGSCTSIG